MTFVTILLTVLAVLAFQKMLVRIAARSSDRDWLEDLYGRAYFLCDAMGLAVPVPEPEDVKGLDRYNEDHSLPAIFPRITKIVVPDEYSRVQVMLAIRYLHDRDIDTGYMAVNDLVHCYTDHDGEPSGQTPWIVVEADHGQNGKVADIDTRNGDLVIMRDNDRYTITVDGVERHPNLNPDSAIGAMAHYLHAAEDALMKLKNM